MSAQLIHGECMAAMAALPAASCDLVLNDPPYGTTANAWDKALDWRLFWRQLLRLGKPHALYIFFTAMPMAADILQANRAMFRYDLVWEKTLPVGFLNCSRAPLRKHEILLVFSGQGAKTYNPIRVKGKPYAVTSLKKQTTNYGKFNNAPYSRKSNDRYPTSILCYGRDQKNYQKSHPTAKPTALLQWLIRTYSNPGDLVLDPTMGGGSTGEACLLTGRRFVGIERDPDFFDMACARLGQSSRSMRTKPA